MPEDLSINDLEPPMLCLIIEVDSIAFQIYGYGTRHPRATLYP
jgi:hypothetical protein